MLGAPLTLVGWWDRLELFEPVLSALYYYALVSPFSFFFFYLFLFRKLGAGVCIH